MPDSRGAFSNLRKYPPLCCCLRLIYVSFILEDTHIQYKLIIDLTLITPWAYFECGAAVELLNSCALLSLGENELNDVTGDVSTSQSRSVASD